MNKALLLTAAAAAFAFSASAFAYTPKDTIQPATPAVKLVPSKVVKPTNLPLSYTRGIVNVEFSLDQDGQPRDIKFLNQVDRAVKEQVAKAFAQWKFDVSARDASDKRFVLPLDIVPEV